MRRTHARRLRGSIATLVALAASVALHLLLVALLLAGRPAPPPARQAVSFEVELRSAPAPVAPAVPAAPTGRRSGGSRRAAAAGPRSGATPDATVPPGSHRNTLDGIEAPSLRGAPDLRARWPGLPPEPDAAGVTAPAGDPLRDWAREQAARARVESGPVHPYYRDVGRALLGAWDAERVIRRHGLSGYLAEAGDNLRAFGRVWHEMAQGFGRTGAPSLIDGASDRMKELSGLPPGPARDALVGNEIQRQLRPAYSKGHVTLVRVTQAADGRLLAVELVSPSKDFEVDRAAVEDVRAAAATLPVPPDHARAAHDTLVSTWEFELDVSITPPLPMIALEFDEVLRVTDVRVPLDRRIWKRVRLVAVD